MMYLYVSLLPNLGMTRCVTLGASHDMHMLYGEGSRPKTAGGEGGWGYESKSNKEKQANWYTGAGCDRLCSPS